MPKLLLVHGTGASAIAWAEFFPSLSSNFDLYVLDVPKNLNVKALHAVIGQYDEIAIIGHSFGAYVAAQYALVYHEQVTHLGLVSPAGLLPTLGCYGYWWAWVFRNQWLVKLLYQLCGYGVTHINNDVMPFISLTWTTAYWNAPLFNLLGYLRCNVCTFYGVYDTITPSHQGKFIERTVGIPCKEIKNTGHCFHGEAAITLSREIVYWYQSRTPTLKKVNLDTRTWASSWNPWHTESLINTLYLSL